MLINNANEILESALKLSKNIAPIAFFLYKNSELNASTMKNFVATCKEY